MKTTAILTCAALASIAGASLAAPLTPNESLGKKLLFDTNLSRPTGQACATCHAPDVGFTVPDAEINAQGAVHPGAVETRFGNRKPPSYGYAGFAPNLTWDGARWAGGLFWDGRATGGRLGDPLAEQAQGPFLNPVEQNLPNAQAVCNTVKASNYAGLFARVWGTRALNCTDQAVAVTYEKIARSIAAYERSPEIDAFSSSFDAFFAAAQEAELEVTAIDTANMDEYAGLGLDSQQLRGLALFNTQGQCSNCHTLASVNGKAPIFTDFSFDNLGVPKNPENPFYNEPEFNPEGADWVDPGLGGYLKGAGYDPSVYEAELGKMQVPTLRNVDKRPTPGFVKAYSHNGYFKSLESIVHFYNTRDLLPDCAGVLTPDPGANCWPAAEEPRNVNTAELGNLGLSAQDEADIVAFLKTLSDKP